MFRIGETWLLLAIRVVIKAVGKAMRQFVCGIRNFHFRVYLSVRFHGVLASSHSVPGVFEKAPYYCCLVPAKRHKNAMQRVMGSSELSLAKLVGVIPFSNYTLCAAHGSRCLRSRLQTPLKVTRHC